MKLLKNGKIIDFKNNIFKDVNILIDNKKIVKILDINDKLPIIEDKNIIDCNGSIILYGFINSQSYLLKNFYYKFFKENSLENFEENYEKFKKNLTDEEKYYIYKYQMLNAIKNGVVTICDEDLFNLPLKKAVIETKLNFVYKLGLINSQSELEESLINKLNNSGENFIFSLNSVLFNTENNFNNMIKYSRKYNKPLLINGSENLFTAGEIFKEFNYNNLTMLEKLGFLDGDNIINNSNVLEKDEYQILNEYNSKLIFSPSLNLNLSYKNANIYALNKQNLVGLSSFNNDYILELFLARNLEKDSYNTMEIFNDETLLNLAVLNNAKILGLKNMGEIKTDNFANLILINNNNIMSVNSFIKNLDNRDIKSVIINGELIYNNFHFVENKDYNKLETLCNNIVKKLI